MLSLPAGKTKRQFYIETLGALKLQRKTWDDHWQAVSEVTHSRRIEIPFTKSTRNRTVRNERLMNNRALSASRVLKSGLFAGICSPSDVWFRLTTPDPEQALGDEEVQVWLGKAERVCREQIAKTNIYDGLEQTIDDLVDYGVAALHLDEDLRTVLRAYHYTIGSYCLSKSARGEIDTVYRECAMTVGAIVEKFGLDTCSHTIRDMYRRGQIHEWVDLLHVIQPNMDFRSGARGPDGKRWHSCWLEVDAGDQEQVLGVGGYREFPVLAPRWKTDGESVYGVACPGMDALPDARELQALEVDKSGLTAKLVRPPLMGPASMQNSRISLIPGDITYIDNASAGATLEPIITVDPRSVEMALQAMEDVRERIDDSYLARLWLVLAASNSSGKERTATEIQQLREEQRLQLAPTTQRFHGELLRPLVQRVFLACLRAGKIPPWPRQLVGTALKVEFQSVFTQAQKATAVMATERFLAVANGLVQLTGDPSAADKVDSDATLEIVADGLGVPPEVTRDQKAVDARREGRAAAAQQEAEQQQALATAEAMSKLGKVDLGANTPVSRIVSETETGLRGAA